MRRIRGMAFILMLLVSTNLYAASAGLMTASMNRRETFIYADTVENHKLSVGRSGNTLMVECLDKPYTFYIQTGTVGFEVCPSCEKDFDLMGEFNRITYDRIQHNSKFLKNVVVIIGLLALVCCIISDTSSGIKRRKEMNKKLLDTTDSDKYLDCDGNELSIDDCILYDNKSYRVYNGGLNILSICLDSEEQRLDVNHKINLTDLKQLDRSKIQKVMEKE